MSAFIDIFTLSVSYPLRLMSTYLSVFILKLFGFQVTACRTQINLDDGTASLAITDSCGGIEQLAGLIVVGVVFAGLMQKRWFLKVFHFSMFLPSVVIANAVRLVLTVALLECYGKTVLGNSWHLVLGWLQAVLVVLLLWAFGKLIRLSTDRSRFVV